VIHRFRETLGGPRIGKRHDEPPRVATPNVYDGAVVHEAGAHELGETPLSIPRLN
jgi:hypothetical protein